MKWIKSSYSFANGNCVEVAAWRKPARSLGNGECVEVGEWRNSARCQNGECVEAGTAPGIVAVRDSQDPGGPVLAFSPEAWRAFLAGAA